MADKRRFSFLMRQREAEALKRIAEVMDRSQGAALRILIRRADRELADMPMPTNSLTQAADREAASVDAH